MYAQHLVWYLVHPQYLINVRYYHCHHCGANKAGNSRVFPKSPHLDSGVCYFTSLTLVSSSEKWDNNSTKCDNVVNALTCYLAIKPSATLPSKMYLLSVHLVLSTCPSGGGVGLIFHLRVLGL